MDFETRHLDQCDVVAAPDGSRVRILAGMEGGGMAHFSLRPGEVAKAARHRTIEEIWFIVSGRGRMWRKSGAREEIVELAPGVAVTIPTGTWFQFRADEGGDHTHGELRRTKRGASHQVGEDEEAGAEEHGHWKKEPVLRPPE